MPSKRFTHVVSILLFLFFCICPSVFAAFNLIATPNDGGFDLRFNRVSPNDFKAAKEMGGAGGLAGGPACAVTRMSFGTADTVTNSN